MLKRLLPLANWTVVPEPLVAIKPSKNKTSPLLSVTLNVSVMFPDMMSIVPTEPPRLILLWKAMAGFEELYTVPKL
jgi:hypothetical protein